MKNQHKLLRLFNISLVQYLYLLLDMKKVGRRPKLSDIHPNPMLPSKTPTMKSDCAVAR